MSGVYQISIDQSPLLPLRSEVYCGMEDLDGSGPGWTYIQSRVDASVDFYRFWWEYEDGFGTPGSNFWVGLRALHQMTRQPTELMVYLETFSGGSRYARYSNFSVGNSSTNYRLSVSGYTGTAGDSLGENNNMMFSTRGRDNDVDSNRHCAEDNHHKGGWWYRFCTVSNLNGVYYSSTYTGSYWGIHWAHYIGRKSPIFKHVHMKIRRKSTDF